MVVVLRLDVLSHYSVDNHLKKGWTGGFVLVSEIDNLLKLEVFAIQPIEWLRICSVINFMSFVHAVIENILQRTFGSLSRHQVSKFLSRAGPVAAVIVIFWIDGLKTIKEVTCAFRFACGVCIFQSTCRSAIFPKRISIAEKYDFVAVPAVVNDTASVPQIKVVDSTQANDLFEFVNILIDGMAVSALDPHVELRFGGILKGS